MTNIFLLKRLYKVILNLFVVKLNKAEYLFLLFCGYSRGYFRLSSPNDVKVWPINISVKSL